MAKYDGARRYAFIDSARGVAACLVMLEHALEGAGLMKVTQGAFALSWFNVGEVGVVTFFFVSGFVIPMSLEKWNNITHFWLNRLLRIYPLYFSVYFASLILANFAGLTLAGFGWSLLAHAFFIQEFTHMMNLVTVAWTLSLEAVWYAGFTLLFIFSLNRKSAWCVGLAVAFALAACVCTLAGPVRLPMGRVSLLLVCVAGLLCLRKERGDMEARPFALGMLILAAMILVDLIVGFALRPSNSPLTPSLLCVALSWIVGVAIFFLPFYHRTGFFITNRALRHMGTISYSVYLLHPLVILVLSRMGVSGFAFVAATMILTVALSGLTYRFIELPMIAFSHRLRPPKSAVE